MCQHKRPATQGQRARGEVAPRLPARYPSALTILHPNAAGVDVHCSDMHMLCKNSEASRIARLWVVQVFDLSV